MNDDRHDGRSSLEGGRITTDLDGLIGDFSRLKVVVLGDALLDGYLEGVTTGVCREAPVPVVTVRQQAYAPGGAGNTASNVAGLGGQVVLLSAIGTDREGDRLCEALEECGVSTNYVIRSKERQTVAKYRVRADAEMLVRLDQGTGDPLDAGTEHALVANLLDVFSTCDAVIISDYGYGIVTPRVIKVLEMLQARARRILVVDSRRDLTAFRHAGVTAVKPNYAEAIQLLEGLDAAPAANRVETIADRGHHILELTRAQSVIVTMDRDGAMVFERGRPVHRTFGYPARQARAAGAGDTFVSALALALAAGATARAAAELASAAAAIVVEKEGTVACSVRALRGSG